MVVRIVTRYGDMDPGVIVVASIPSKTDPELEAQVGRGLRRIPLDELDARSQELLDLVNDAAAKVESAVAGAPPQSFLPDRREDDFDNPAHEALIESSYRVKSAQKIPWRQDASPPPRSPKPSMPRR